MRLAEAGNSSLLKNRIGLLPSLPTNLSGIMTKADMAREIVQTPKKQAKYGASLSG